MSEHRNYLKVSDLVFEDGSPILVGHILRFMRDNAQTDAEAAFARVAADLCVRDGMLNEPITQLLLEEISAATTAHMTALFMRGVEPVGFA